MTTSPVLRGPTGSTLTRARVRKLPRPLAYASLMPSRSVSRFFGSVAAGQLPDARAGDVLAATVDGVRCGGTTLVAGPEGAVIYALHVDSAAVRPQCGVTGSIVSLELDGRVVATTRWENGRAQFVELGAVSAGALPPSRAGEGENRQHFPRTER